MPPASSLSAAAGQAADNLAGRWVANQLKLQLNIYWSTNIRLFPEAEPNSHPVSNWFVVLASIEQVMPFGQPPLSQLITATNALYRLLWMASFAQDAGLISADQGNTILASYNSVIAFP